MQDTTKQQPPPAAATQSAVQLIDKANDISAFASRDANRYVLNGIYANGKGTEATDGHVCIRVPFVALDVATFPTIENVSDEREAVILPVKAVQEAIRNAGTRSIQPALNCVRLSTVKRGDSVRAQFATTDLDSNRVVETKAIEGAYPSLDVVWPTAEPTLSISVNATILKQIADYAIKHGLATGSREDEYAVRLDFTDNLSAIRFAITLTDGRKATGVAMPMRMA